MLSVRISSYGEHERSVRVARGAAESNCRDVTNTRNGERGTGNGERGTGNGERGTGNGERGTGNGERRTGIWELVYSGNPLDNLIQSGRRRKREDSKAGRLEEK